MAANAGEILLDREVAYLRRKLRERATGQRRTALASALDGQISAAIEGFEALVKRPEAQWWDYQNLGLALVRQGQREQGEKWLRRAARDAGADTRPATALAVSRWLDGDKEGALSALRGPATDRRLAAWRDALTGMTPGADSYATLLAAVADHAKATRVQLKLAYLAVQTGLTGGMKIFFEQANWLARRGHEVRVLAHDLKPSWLELSADFQRVPFYELLSSHAQDADIAVSAFWTQNHDLERAWPATRVFLAQGDSYVWAPETMPPVLQEAALLSHSTPASVLAVSPALADRMETLYHRRPGVVPNGLDTSLFRPRPKGGPGPLRIMAVGRDGLEFKGLQDVFAAVEIVRRQGVDCELIWASPSAPQTEEVQCRFYQRPPQETLAELYAEADIYVSGSRYESFSLPCLEAMACGTAVVSADNAGVRTYARHGENCLLVPPASPEAMAQAILSLAHDPALRRQLAESGIQTAAHYNWERVAEQLEEALYRLWLGDLFADADPRTARRETISLCVIAKDEAASIKRCLTSAAAAVDEMIVVDTGSTDGTGELARQCGARVYSHAWQNDFADARNESLRHAKGDWVLWLDADEELQLPDPQALQSLIQANLGAEGLFLNIQSLTDESDPTSRIVHSSPRLFRNRAHHRFEGAIHEQIQASIERGGGKVLPTDLSVLHYGYLPQVRQAKQKEERNVSLLQSQVASQPENSFAHFNLATEHYVAGRYPDALEEYQAAYRTGAPEDRKAQYFSKLMRNLGNCLLILGDYDSAREVLNEALQIYPDYTDLWMQQAQLEERLGAWDSALQALDHCLELGDAPARYLSLEGTGTWTAWYRKGTIWERLGKLSEAVSSYAASVNLQPTFREPALRLAFLLVQPELDEAVMASIEAALEQSTYRDELLTQAHYKARRYSRAGQFAERAPRSGTTALARAAAAIAAGRPQEALEDLQGVSLDPGERVDAMRLAAVCAWQEGRWQDAMQIGEALQQQALAAGSAITGVSQALDVMGAAVSGAAEAPTPWDEVDGLLGLLVDLGQYELFEKALRIYSLYPRAGWQGHVGKMLNRRGFSDLAFEFLAADRELVPNDEEALQMLADLALDKGYAVEAEALYRQAMGLSANPRTYLPRLAAALLKAGKAAEAARTLAQIAATQEELKDE